VRATVSIDALVESDAPRCAELEMVLFPGDDPWSEQAFRDGIRAGHHYVAARSLGGARVEWARSLGGARVGAAGGHDGVLIGYAGLAFVASPPQAEAEVHTIGVDPAHQHRGVGRALLGALLGVADAAAATVFLEVRTDNDPARGLYEAEGFSVVGLPRRNYRPSGADAHTMRRDPAR